jgi:hypothetical protein
MAYLIVVVFVNGLGMGGASSGVIPGSKMRALICPPPPFSCVMS